MAYPSFVFPESRVKKTVWLKSVRAFTTLLISYHRENDKEDLLRKLQCAKIVKFFIEIQNSLNGYSHSTVNKLSKNALN